MNGCWLNTTNWTRWRWMGCASGVVLIISHTSTAPSRGISVTGSVQVRFPKVINMGFPCASSSSWSSKCRWSAVPKLMGGIGTTESENASRTSWRLVIKCSWPSPTSALSATIWIFMTGVEFETALLPGNGATAELLKKITSPALRLVKSIITSNRSAGENRRDETTWGIGKRPPSVPILVKFKAGFPGWPLSVRNTGCKEGSKSLEPSLELPKHHIQEALVWSCLS